MRFPRRGFSLIEIVIASFILGIVIVIVYSILASQQKAVDEGSRTSECETRARVVVDALKEELFYAKLDYTDVSILQDGKYLKYQVANRTGAFAYGYPDAAGTFQPNWWAVVTFVADRYIREPAAVASPSPFDQSPVNMNKNLLTDEVFAVGRIVRRVFTDTGALNREVTLCGDVILNNASLDNGDIDGDGQTDPMFELQDGLGNPALLAPAQVKMVKLNVFVGLFDFDRTKFFMRNCSQQVKFKNSQN